MDCTLYPLRPLTGYNVSIHVSDAGICGYVNYHVIMALIFGGAGVLAILFFLPCICSKTNLGIIAFFLCLAFGIEGLVLFIVFACLYLKNQFDVHPEQPIPSAYLVPDAPVIPGESVIPTGGRNNRVPTVRNTPEVVIVGDPSENADTARAIPFTGKMTRHGPIPIRLNVSCFFADRKHYT